MSIDAALTLGLAEPAPPEAAPRVAPDTQKRPTMLRAQARR